MPRNEETSCYHGSAAARGPSRALASLAIDVVAALDTQELPAVAFEETAECLARERLHPWGSHGELDHLLRFGRPRVVGRRRVEPGLDRLAHVRE